MSTVQEVFEIKARAVHGDKYTYGEYISAKELMIVTCPIHGAFLQKPRQHLDGRGCRTCADISKRIDFDAFVSRARATHGGRYQYIPGSYTQISMECGIVCPIHGPFMQLGLSHVKGHGCQECANSIISAARTSTQAEFEARARAVHGDVYSYGEYTAAHKKIKIICPVHGEFKMSPSNHIAGGKHPSASNNKLKTQEQFERKAREVHGNKYTYGSYTTARKKIKITCPDHGEFEQTPNSHLGGSGCMVCSGKLPITQEQFESKARSVHGNKYTYGLYKSALKKIKITCPVHGEFKLSPDTHYRGCGCPQCTTSGYSLAQITWLEYVSSACGINILHKLNGGEFSIPGTRYSADGYCQETNTIYEFHGDAFHGNPGRYISTDKCHPFDKTITAGELYASTIARENIIKELGYNLVVMWELDWRISKK